MSGRGKPYLYERQSEYWTSRGVEDYFLNAGFQVVVFPLHPFSERRLPVDFLFHEAKTGKLFGLQYKALYQDEPNYWPVDPIQHMQLLEVGGLGPGHGPFPAARWARNRPTWLYYGLSELRAASDHRNAVHKLILLHPENVDAGDGKLYETALGGDRIRYYRWGGFVAALESCKAGAKVTSEEDIRDRITPLMPERGREAAQIVDCFVANFEDRRMLHLAPDISQWPADTPDPDGQRRG